jgi:hypothetical protein
MRSRSPVLRNCPENKFRIVARQFESPGLESRRQVVYTLALPTVACKPPDGGTATH